MLEAYRCPTFAPTTVGLGYLRIVEYSRPDAPATLEGYAKAVDLPCDRSEVYVQDLGMLDTDYAAMLENLSQ